MKIPYNSKDKENIKQLYADVFTKSESTSEGGMVTYDLNESKDMGPANSLHLW